MRVSVIIPVYNAAAYVAQAVQSALDQPETVEVLLVEDGSRDDSLAICQQLAADYDRVTLYQHPGGTNRGAGASRNLGIQRSTSPYIAFLDADDFFLPGRFAVASQRFDADPRADGVYGATGVHFQTDEARRHWVEDYKPQNIHITTMKPGIAPEALFMALVYDTHGHFTTDAIVVKREVFARSGLFDTTLRLHQDTAMWIKLATCARLVGGSLTEPVAMRRVHAANRITARLSAWDVQRSRVQLWHTLHYWGRAHLDADQQRAVIEAYMKAMLRPYHSMPYGVRQARLILRLLGWTLRHPGLLRSRAYRYELITRLIAYAGLHRALRTLGLLPSDTSTEERA